MVCLQGPMTNLARVSVFCPPSFFLVASVLPYNTYLVEHAVMYSYFARYYINTQAEKVPTLLAVSKSTYKRAGLATTYCETY